MQIMQISRFLIVGAISTLINYGIFFILYKITGLFYTWASIIGYLSGLVAGFFINRSWTFSSVLKNKVAEIILYSSVYLTSLAINIIVLKICVEIMSINPLISNILAIGVSTVTNYFGCKYTVFNQKFTNFISKLLGSNI